MAFGNADIERAVGHGLHHDVHGATRRHGRCDTDDAIVLPGQLKECLTEHILIFRRLVAVVAHQAFTSLGIELSGCMPDGGLLFGGLIALALRGMQMQELRSAHFLQLPENAHQLLHVMSVERSEIADVHAFEDVLLVGQCRLQRIVQSNEAFAAVVVHHATCLQPLRCLEAQAVIGGIGVELQKIFLHSANGTVDRHVVIVQDDEQVVIGGRHIVESLESQTAAHRTIADDGHHLRCGLMALRLRSHRHAQCGRDAVGGMTTGECVVLTLIGRRERADATQLAIGGESLAATSEHLMPIGLMSHVPDKAVSGSIEDVVQRHREFNDAQR